MTRRTHAAAPTPEHSQFLDDLGGPAKIAAYVSERLSMDPPMTPQAVSMWRKRGIPHGYRMALAVMAQAHGVAVPGGFFFSHRPPADRTGENYSEDIPADDTPGFLRGSA